MADPEVDYLLDIEELEGGAGMELDDELLAVNEIQVSAIEPSPWMVCWMTAGRFDLGTLTFSGFLVLRAGRCSPLMYPRATLSRPIANA